MEDDPVRDHTAPQTLISLMVLGTSGAQLGQFLLRSSPTVASDHDRSHREGFLTRVAASQCWLSAVSCDLS